MPLNCGDPLFFYLLIQKWESQTHFIYTQRWELPPCSVILDKALLNCPGQKQFVWSTGPPYNAIWSLRDKFTRTWASLCLVLQCLTGGGARLLLAQETQAHRSQNPVCFCHCLEIFCMAKGTQQFTTSFHVPSQLRLHPQKSPELYRHTFRNPNSLKSVSKHLKKTNLVRCDVMPKARCVWKSLLVSQAFYFMPREEVKSSP